MTIASQPGPGARHDHRACEATNVQEPTRDSPSRKYRQLFDAIALGTRGTHHVADPEAFDMLPRWCEANGREWFEAERGVPAIRVRWVVMGTAVLNVTP